VEELTMKIRAPELHRFLMHGYFWRGANASQLERIKFMQMYAGDSRQTGENNTLMVRRIFCKFSSFLVATPVKAFRFDKQQFLRMCKDMGLTKDIKLNVLDEIFSVAADPFDPKGKKEPFRMWSSEEVGKFCAAVNKGGKVAKKAIAARKAKITPKPPNEDDGPKMTAAQKKKIESEIVFTIDQFVEILTRIAIHVYCYAGGKPKGGDKSSFAYIRGTTWQAGLDTDHLFAKVFKPPTVAAAFQRFIDEYLWPASHDSPDIVAKQAMDEGQDLMDDVPEIQDVLKKQKKFLKKVFSYYSDSENMKNVSAKDKLKMKGQLEVPDQAADTMSIVEFLWMGQELDFCKLYNFTPAVMINIFIVCNHEEVEDFLKGTVAGDLQELLQMNYEEFELALLMLAKRFSDMAPPSSKFKVLPTMLDSMTNKMIDNFSPEKLRQTLKNVE